MERDTWSDFTYCFKIRCQENYISMNQMNESLRQKRDHEPEQENSHQHCHTVKFEANTKRTKSSDFKAWLKRQCQRKLEPV